MVLNVLRNFKINNMLKISIQGVVTDINTRYPNGDNNMMRNDCIFLTTKNVR